MLGFLWFLGEKRFQDGSKRMLGQIDGFLLLEERYRTKYSDTVEEVIYRVASIGQGKSSPSMQLHLLCTNKEPDDFLRMWMDEEKVCTWAKHTGLQRLYDAGVWEGKAYRVVEEISDLSLATLMAQAKKRGRILSLGMICYVGEKICEVLSYLHSVADEKGRAMGFFYRELASEHVFLSNEGEVKLRHLSLAKWPWRADTLHSSEPKNFERAWKHLAPELVRGLPADFRVDLYALGAFLFEMWTGDVVFSGKDELSLLQTILKESPRAPSSLREGLPPEIEHLFLRLLRKSPEEREISLDVVRGALSQEASKIEDVVAELAQLFG